jgi:dolichyl-phosphate beta-glucosyltransferase
MSAPARGENFGLCFSFRPNLSMQILETAVPTKLDSRLMAVDPTPDDRLLGYSIIIPAYNEGARVGATLDKVLAHVTEQGWDAEIVVVDDGSCDNTVEIIRGYAEKNPRLRLLQNPGNRGKGYSVRNGMLQARGELLLFSDADLSSPIEEADKLFAAMAGGADIAIGSRWLRRDLQTQRQPLYRQLFGRVFNLMLRMVLGLRFKDTQCGFKAFTRSSAKTIFPLQRIERWGFDPELLYLARKKGFKVAEVPVEWAHREGTRISPLRDGTRMFLEMLKIRWNGATGKYDGDGK